MNTNLARLEMDERAREIAVSRYGLPPCLHIPIAARDEVAIQKYIGRIEKVMVPGQPNKALIVHMIETPELNARYPIWRIPNSAVLHQTKQVWVHVDFNDYRKAYAMAFPDDNLTNIVLDHVLNRRAARLKGFEYIRIVPISRGANSSSGGLCEKWGVELQLTPPMVIQNRDHPTFVQYADLADIVKMLDIKTGGSLQDAVNETQKLVQEE